MKKLRLSLLLICVALVTPALSQAQDCQTRCQNEWFQCVMTSCGGSFCSECDSVYLFCMNWC